MSRCTECGATLTNWAIEHEFIVCAACYKKKFSTSEESRKVIEQNAQDEINRLNAQILDRDTKIESLQAEITNRDEERDSLIGQQALSIEYLQAEIAQLHKELEEVKDAFALVKKLHIIATEECVQLRRNIETWNVYAKEREATITQQAEVTASLKAQLEEAQNRGMTYEPAPYYMNPDPDFKMPPVT